MVINCTVALGGVDLLFVLTYRFIKIYELSISEIVAKGKNKISYMRAFILQAYQIIRFFIYLEATSFQISFQSFGIYWHLRRMFRIPHHIAV